ncbi:MAG: hypothetical protein ABR576_08480 [Thermoanaerobaculia bacterium]
MERPIVRSIEAFALDDRWSRAIPFLAAAAIFAGARALPEGSSRRWFLSLAAISPLLLLHAGEARAYALFALLSLGVFLLASRSRESAPAAVALALLAAAALYTHYLGLFVVAALLGLTLIQRRFLSAAGLGGGVLLFLPWTRILREQPPEATQWIRDAPLETAAGLLGGLGGAPRLAPALGGPLPRALILAGAAASLLLTGALLRASRRDPALRTALAFVGLTFGALLAVSFWRPAAFPGRSEMAVLPVWFWAAARGAASDRACRAAAGAVALVSLIAGALVLRAQAANMPPWEPATAALARVSGRGDLVLAAGPFYLPARLAADRGEAGARVVAFPPELAEHPGWISPRAPFRDDGRAREAARVCRRGCRLVFLGYLPHFTRELQEIFREAGAPRILWRRGQAVIIRSEPPPPPTSPTS